jgi:hypothetical protein
MAHTAYLGTLPGWGELCRPEASYDAPQQLLHAIAALRAHPPRLRYWIARWLAGAMIRDPSALKLLELSWDELLDIASDQGAGNRILASAALDPTQLQPVCARPLNGFSRPFSQLPCTRATTRARAQKALQLVRRDEPVLVLGDDDMVGVALAEAGFCHVTAVDIDEQVLASVRAEAYKLGVEVQTLHHDLNDPLPSALRTPLRRLVFIDPMYSLGGVELFLRGALAATGRQAGARIFLSLHLLSLGRAGLAQLETMLERAGLAVDEILRGFNSYAVPPRLRLPLSLANRLLLGDAWGTTHAPLPFFFSDALILRQL